MRAIHKFPAEIQKEIEQKQLSVNITPNQLRLANDDQLLSLQKQLGLGSIWGRLDVPPAWLPPHRGRAECTRTYRVALALPKGMKSGTLIGRQVWRELLRVAIALAVFPGRRSGQVSKYSTILNKLSLLGALTRHIAQHPGDGFWKRVTHDHAASVFGNERTKKSICRSLLQLHMKGAIEDCVSGRPMPKGEDRPRDRTGEPEDAIPPVSTNQWQPFPDVYTSTAGWHAIQMLKRVGPTLLDALEAASDVPIRKVNLDARSPRHKKALSKKSKAYAKRTSLDPIIASWNWIDMDGSPMHQLPFSITLALSGGDNFLWPPQTHGQAQSLLKLLQASHLWIIALALASRHGEILGMTEGSIKQDRRGTERASFTTWKLDGVIGRETDSPLPPLVVTALLQQERLARLIKKMNKAHGNHLWVQIAKGLGKPLNSFAGALLMFNKAFGLEPLLEGTSAHMHRFRKTLARIIALALVHAPKILMDVLCHRDEQMTVVRYILSDPGILNEIQEVVRELIILKGIEAVEKRDQLQGAGASLLRERVEAYGKRLGTKAMEPQNLLEFVRAMTENGSGWAIIAPGIVCTGFKLGGMCNQGQGDANPHYCHPACTNQLVMPDFQDGAKVSSAVTNAIETIDYALDALNRAGEEEDEMSIAQFAGQVKSILNRWREVDQHYAANTTMQRFLPNVVLLP